MLSVDFHNYMSLDVVVVVSIIPTKINLCYRQLQIYVTVNFNNLTYNYVRSIYIYISYLSLQTAFSPDRSNKLKPFWLSITEKEALPILDFLSAALLSAEYERALGRALAMPECHVVPFFGAFLRELREILAATPSLVVLAPTGEHSRLEVRPTPPSGTTQRHRPQHRHSHSHHPVVSHLAPWGSN